MKTITNNDDYVRLRIFEGELPAEDGVKELLRLERAQHEATKRELLRVRGLLADAVREGV